MRFTFTVPADSDIGDAARRAEKRAEKFARREADKAMRLERSGKRRDKAALRRIFA